VVVALAEELPLAVNKNETGNNARDRETENFKVAFFIICTDGCLGLSMPYLGIGTYVDNGAKGIRGPKGERENGRQREIRLYEL
jgi:hypothetical protein